MRAELMDALEFPYADSQVRVRPTAAATLDVPRGGTVSAHVLLNDLPPGKRVRLAIKRGNRTVESCQWFLLHHVPVETNTGLVGFIEKKGEPNPHVIRRAPFRVYDAMEPVGSSFTAPEAGAVARLQIPMRPDTRPGERQYDVSVTCGDARVEISLTVVVHRAVVPPVGRDSFPYTNWFSLDEMAARHGLNRWSDAHWRMIRRYAELMAHGRQNTFWIPLQYIFESKRGTPVLDRDRLKRLVDLFTRAGMHYIEGGHVAGRTGGEWGATTFDTAVVPVRATSVEGNAVLAAIGSQLMGEIDRHGWRDRWIQHTTDEPAESNAVDYRILTGMVRRHMPGLPILDATMEPSLVGSVDIWCPQVQEYQKHRDRFEAQRDLGDRIWFYTCCFPGGPWLNRLLDQELLRPALFGWAAALYDLHGYLHWGLNHYKSFQDPFRQSVVDHGGGNCLPPGDTHIVYPGAGRPWSSLRLEAQREGCEDYELLRQLKEADPRRARSIVRRAIQGFDRYTRHPKTFRRARRSLLEALA